MDEPFGKPRDTDCAVGNFNFFGSPMTYVYLHKIKSVVCAFTPAVRAVKTDDAFRDARDKRFRCSHEQNAITMVT